MRIGKVKFSRDFWKDVTYVKVIQGFLSEIKIIDVIGNDHELTFIFTHDGLMEVNDYIPTYQIIIDRSHPVEMPSYLGIEGA